MKCSASGDSLAATTSGDGERQALPERPPEAVAVLRDGHRPTDFHEGVGPGVGPHAGSGTGSGAGSEAETSDTPASDLRLHHRPLAPRQPDPAGGGRPGHGEDDRAFWSDLAPAPRIDGYDVLRRLKHGGQGVVYLAVQRSTKRKVAVKLLLQGVFATKSARRRFEREIELVASLKHPNIIAVFDSGITPDRHSFYVMDYVRGVPLTQYVRDNALKLEQVLALLATTCEAVSHAHQRGVIHRDLKPSNIMVDVDGNVHVLDFGLAKTLTEPAESVVSVTGSVVGTYPYMSPEQTRGNPDEMDTRTDVYALGVILYEALTGVYPYPVTGTVAEVIRHICETPPAPPAKSWTAEKGVPARPPGGGMPGAGAVGDALHKLARALRLPAGRRTGPRCPVDADLATIVLKALAKERERRYDSAGQFARDLRRYLAGDPIVARPPSPWYQVRVFARRHTALAGASLSIFAVLLVSVAVLTRQLKELRAANALAHNESARATAEAKAADDLRRRGEEIIASSEYGFGFAGDEHADDNNLISARRLYVKALDQAREARLSGSATLAGLLEIGGRPGGALPLMGSYGGTFGPGGFRGHSDKPNNVAVLPGRRRALTAGGDGELILWDLVTGARLRSVQTRHVKVNYVAVAPDESWAVTAGEDGTVRRWGADDLSGGEAVMTLPPRNPGEGPERPWMVAVSDDGKRILAGGSAGSLVLWDAAGKDRVVGDCGESCPALAFVPGDSRFVLSGDGGGKLRLWDLDAPGEVWDEPVSHQKDAAHGEPHNQVNSVAFSADKRTVASVSFDGSLVVWDAQWDARGGGGRGLRLSRRFPAVEEPHEWLWRVAISDDNRSVATAARSGKVRVYDAHSGNLLHEFRAQSGEVNGVAFLDARTLVSTGDNQRDDRGRMVNSALAVWDVGAGAGTHVAAEVSDVSIDDSGRVKVITAVGALERHIAKDGRLTDEAGRDVESSIARVPSGQYTDANTPTWSLALRSTLPPDPNRRGGGAADTSDDRPRELAPVPGGRAKLYAGAGGTLQLWGTPKPSPDHPAGAMVPMRTFYGHKGRVVAARLSPGGRYIVSADDQGTVIVWDLFRPLRGRELAQRVAATQDRLKGNPNDATALAALREWYAFWGREMPKE